MPETSSSKNISTKLERIAKLARNHPKMEFTTLAHHIDEDWLREAYRRTRKTGAAGIDGQTAKEYAEGLEDRLEKLLTSAKTGRYRAPPVRRVYIPKGKGETRPLGIPTFEDIPLDPRSPTSAPLRFIPQPNEHSHPPVPSRPAEPNTTSLPFLPHPWRHPHQSLPTRL